MKTRLTTSIVALLFVLAGATAAHAQSLSDTLGGLSWGASVDEVLAQQRRMFTDQFRERTRGVRDPARVDSERRAADARYQEVVASLESFDGALTGYEVGVIGNELTTGQDLSMLTVRDGESIRYYIFRSGRLAKVAVPTDIARLDFLSFDDFVDGLRRQFGRPDSTEDVRDEWEVPTMVRAVWTDRRTRLRVENRRDVYNSYVLVLTDATQPDFVFDTSARAAADRGAGGLDAIMRGVEASRPAATGNVVDRIIGQQTDVQVRLRSDQGGQAVVSRTGTASAMDDNDTFEDVPLLERSGSGSSGGSRSRTRDSGRSGSGSGSGSGGGVTIF